MFSYKIIYAVYLCIITIRFGQPRNIPQNEYMNSGQTSEIFPWDQLQNEIPVRFAANPQWFKRSYTSLAELLNEVSRERNGGKTSPISILRFG
ncbi:hypothetical protein PHET_00358 [Paragonimus heterotremus]|uniref:Uncharacterized protein n=1 Tax=Paragonimus heterotremus TaxID=100268 RepID=A0A8J4WJY0_9TREM|nr:hypothetical protein PHET_00358 [Paragonimus heterotremus]